MKEKSNICSYANGLHIRINEHFKITTIHILKIVKDREKTLKVNEIYQSTRIYQ